MGFASMETVTIVGYLAAICSMTSFTPQAWKIIKTRDTSSISAPMYALTVLGFALWLAFGLLKAEWPIIITNGVCLILSAFILMMTVLPGAKKEAVADAIDPTGRGGDTSPR
jgi:MtN3 and saliva related transmembrane protein